MEPVMALALPRYLPGAAAARIFIFAAAAGGITTLGAIGVVATGRQRMLPLLSATALVINVSCSITALHFGAGLAVVAGGAVIAQATIATGVLAILSEATERGAVALVLKGMIPLAWCVASVALMSRLYDPRTVAGGVASLGTYLVLLLPISPLMVSGFRSARAVS
jgi:hypothetical protein